MKRMILFILISLFVLSLKAQTYKYHTDCFSYKYVNNGRWSEWSDWKKSRILVVINLDRNLISIYSDNKQEYDIYEYVGDKLDKDGGTSVKFNCVNEDGLRCQIRVRVQSDGSRQLYVDFNDMMWVYVLIER